MTGLPLSTMRDLLTKLFGIGVILVMAMPIGLILGTRIKNEKRTRTDKSEGEALN